MGTFSNVVCLFNLVSWSVSPSACPPSLWAHINTYKHLLLLYGTLNLSGLFFVEFWLGRPSHCYLSFCQTPPLGKVTQPRHGLLWRSSSSSSPPSQVTLQTSDFRLQTSDFRLNSYSSLAHTSTPAQVFAAVGLWSASREESWVNRGEEIPRRRTTIIIIIIISTRIIIFQHSLQESNIIRSTLTLI